MVLGWLSSLGQSHIIQKFEQEVLNWHGYNKVLFWLPTNFSTVFIAAVLVSILVLAPSLPPIYWGMSCTFSYRPWKRAKRALGFDAGLLPHLRKAVEAV